MKKIKGYSPSVAIVDEELDEQEATAARIISRNVLDKVAALVAFDTIKAARFPSLRAQYLFSGSTAAYTAARRRFVGSAYDDQTGRREHA